MNKLLTKARAGVTLVELLVVILIVTILSVSMLPLLQPFVTEAQYAAEAIPVIGNIRTKIAVYQYDKTKLPQHTSGTVSINVGDVSQEISSPVVETWMYHNNVIGADSYAKAKFLLKGASVTKEAYESTTTSGTGSNAVTTKNEHIGVELNIDQQDLKGKRSRPPHYEYVVIKNGTDYIYAIGAFGDGNGLKMGTGYAVCEINLPSINRKYVGTWKRYKSIKDTVVHFTNSATLTDNTDTTTTIGCYLPDALGDTINDPGAGNEPTVITNMRSYGWEFN